MRYLYLAKYLLLTMFFITGCQNKPNDPSLIYDALFKHVNGKQSIYYIKNEISNPETHMLSKDYLLLFNSFNFSNSSKSHKLEHFNKTPIKLINLTEREVLFKDGCKLGWKAFHKKYPKALVLIGFSQVGYNSDEEAILYVETGSACLGGRGGFFIFKKNNGTWSFKTYLNLWIA